MRIQKSFIMNYGAKNKKKEVVLELEPQEQIPEMIVEKEQHTGHSLSITHYDDDTPVTLDYTTYASEKTVESTPDYYETYDEVEEVSQGHSLAYSLEDIEDAVILEEKEKEEDLYTRANAYFEEEVPEEDTRAYSEAHEMVQKKPEASKEEVAPTNSGVEEASQEPPLEEALLAVHHENEEIENQKFEEDLKAIFEKKKKSDHEKARLDPSEISKNKSKGVAGKPIEEELQDKMKNNHAIFEQIAQSMDMANTYDFGSIAMNKKFDDLEAETEGDFTQKIANLIGDGKEEIKEKNTPSYSRKKEEDKDKIMTEDFLKDLDTLKELSSEKSKMKEQQEGAMQNENGKEEIQETHKKNAVEDIEDAVIIPEKKEETETPTAAKKEAQEFVK